MTANTVLRLRSPFGQPVSHLADDGEAMCQGAHRGIAGQRQVSAPASNVGLHVGATVGEADFPLGLATVGPALAQHVTIVDSCICVHAEVHVAQGRFCQKHTTYVHVLSLNSDLYGHCAGQRQV